MTDPLRQLRIDGTRLWDSLMEMARIGATDKGGCNRQALTDEDRRGRDLFVDWAQDAGCSVEIDQIGNVFATRTGRDSTQAPVMIGSHLDTQPTGGKFDGVYGVLAGLEVIRTLDQGNVQTDTPITAVVWTNEEGVRFVPAMIGSGVYTGVFTLKEALSITDKQGNTIEQELRRIGYFGDRPAKSRSVTAAFEVHIEQGPILEAENTQIGVLTGIQGLRWYDIMLYGTAAHAGPTPMNVRRDPFKGLADILRLGYDLATQYAPWGRITFGDIHAEPGSRNTVPESLVLAVDVRHPDATTLNRMDAALRDIVRAACDAHNLDGHVDERWHMPVTEFAPECIDAVQGAVDHLGYSSMRMVSGAGHDSLYVASVAPTGMIFVPCADGLSHNEAESATPEDLEAGCNVLLHTVMKMARAHV